MTCRHFPNTAFWSVSVLSYTQAIAQQKEDDKVPPKLLLLLARPLTMGSSHCQRHEVNHSTLIAFATSVLFDGLGLFETLHELFVTTTSGTGSCVLDFIHSHASSPIPRNSICLTSADRFIDMLKLTPPFPQYEPDVCVQHPLVPSSFPPIISCLSFCIYRGGFMPSRWRILRNGSSAHIVVTFNNRVNISSFPNAEGLENKNLGILDRRLAIE
ncbi:hypothetical protein F5050DRAFT_1803674 [Lentinula boryana]|uniref:Uncharacterized protein n=1 Tax=Lentinula boryana TaxID=40481 RepID=A0ABQ8QR92_9AGAR|nr:hypothetical protein F5050DRAFT_1803674 [Lentinula boryana]